MALSNHPTEAISFYKELLKMNKDDHLAMYSIARLYAKLDNTTEAWHWLEASVNKGFNYGYALKFDSLFVNLRKSSKWNALAMRIPLKPLVPYKP
jgi:hypothetical protein